MLLSLVSDYTAHSTALVRNVHRIMYLVICIVSECMCASFVSDCTVSGTLVLLAYTLQS